jgi:DNA polymerase III subunit epsilon
MDFVVIDVETANPDLASICQVGIVSFQNGEVVDSWTSLVDPEDYFYPINIAIHGIDTAKVAGAPTWPQVFPDIERRLCDKVVICHTQFDRSALTRACDRYEIEQVCCTWLDSARIVRRAWSEFAKAGYGLSNVATHFGIGYKAHDALEDARCAGLIVLKAIAETGIEVDQWLFRVNEPIFHFHQTQLRDGGNIANDGELSGEVAVFTGELPISRWEAADAAVSLGARVDEGVTKHTTLFVVGDQDMRKLAGQSQSSKHRKVEALIRKGQQIRLMSGSDFMRMVSLPVSEHIATVNR